MNVKGFFSTSLITPDAQGGPSVGASGTPGRAESEADSLRSGGHQGRTRRRRWTGGLLLIGIILGAGAGLASWKVAAIQESNATSQNQPEPTESVTAAVVRNREHSPTTTAIGTVLALRSITLRNEVPGTARLVRLSSGDLVEKGTVLIALDTSVEEAELAALRAQAALAQTMLKRMRLLNSNRAASEVELDQAIAERDVALAEIARVEAIIARKQIRAPFRARVGIADVHPGQFLNEGTLLTTLQGVDNSVHVDFAVEQSVAATLSNGDVVDVLNGNDARPTAATISAIDARVDPTTRNAIVRARIDAGADDAPAPGSSVKVRVPVGPSLDALVVPVSALRQGSDGDHVFVLEPDEAGKVRAHLRVVRAGDVLDDEVVIEAGLSAGEQVATSGSFKLRDAVLVAVLDTPAVAVRGSR